MEKASVTVKSLGMTSGAYIVSVYEHSSQRLNDMKSYVPTLNMPTVSMPSMNRYAPMNQLATRMRSGMGNMIIQFREFCGTSDAAQTVSMHELKIVDVAAAVGDNTVSGMSPVGGVSDLIDPSNGPNAVMNHTYYQKFLQMIREEHAKRANKSKKTPLHFTTTSKINEEDEFEYESDEDDQEEVESDTEGEKRVRRLRIPRDTTAVTCLADENGPTTSAHASGGSSSSDASSRAEPLLIMVTPSTPVKADVLPSIVLNLEEKLNDSNLEMDTSSEETEQPATEPATEATTAI
jgi:hypothetical protein